MKNLFIILFISLFNAAFSQTIEEIDSVSNVMCDYLKNLRIKNDTVKMNVLYQNQLFPYLSTIEPSKTEKIGQQVYFRLQRNCVEFRNILDKIEPPKEGVVRITEKPKSKISAEDLMKFKERNEFYYFEVAGDTTFVKMQNGNWVDSFTNKTFSNLTYNWINETEFELVFVESNNESRSNFSIKGDKIVYQVLSKEDGYYIMTLNIPGQSTFEKFKLHYK
ncbi:MAG: hypothetical protein H6607_00700 [Flavobacteriales bacterium]|nr:hypothetical protein [Flavobacteriales bacterium]